jgi:hypothetical protein
MPTSPPSPKPIALSEEQMLALIAASHPLDPDRRSPFLEAPSPFHDRVALGFRPARRQAIPDHPVRERIGRETAGGR